MKFGMLEGDLKLLTLHIDNVWELSDFVDALQSVESMYYKLEASKHRKPFRLWPGYPSGYFYLDRELPFERSYTEQLDNLNRFLCERARHETLSPEKLLVKRIQYASPGSIDLLGIGKVCEVMADAIGQIVTFYDERHIRRERDEQASLETEQKRIEIDRDRETLRSLQIQNARDMLELKRDFPDHELEIMVPLLVRDQELLSELIADGRLIGAETKKQP